jgi:hypothetical protein
MIDLSLREATSREQVDQFMDHDAVSDTRFEGAIRRLYKSLETDEQRSLAATVYAVWRQAEAQDDVILGEHAEHIDGTRDYIYQVTPMIVEHDGCGPTGRAA